MDGRMKSHKRSITSVLLQRIAHADVFEIGVLPTFLFILFGGSGMDEDEYEAMHPSDELRRTVQSTLETLHRWVLERHPPFVSDVLALP